MKAEVKWIEDLKFVGKTDKNQEIIFGSGDSTIVSPMEMVLMAAGGCSSVDVVDGLKTAGQKVLSVNAKLTTERRLPDVWRGRLLCRKRSPCVRASKTSRFTNQPLKDDST